MTPRPLQHAASTSTQSRQRSARIRRCKRPAQRNQRKSRNRRNPRNRPALRIPTPEPSPEPSGPETFKSLPSELINVAAGHIAKTDVVRDLAAFYRTSATISISIVLGIREERRGRFGSFDILRLHHTSKIRPVRALFSKLSCGAKLIWRVFLQASRARFHGNQR
jgi:hypothetical protein